MKRLAAVVSGGALLVAGGTTAYLVSADSSTPFSFQAAYNAASAGAVVNVPAGQVVVDSPARGSATIFGTTQKAVTFVCASDAGAGSVTMSPSGPRLTIKAFNITIDGGANRCFNLLVVRVGEGGDTTLTAGNVVVSNAHLMGTEVVGASGVTFLNDEIGPNVGCYAQGRTGTGASGGPISPKMWCDPNGPSYEAQFANRGTSDLTGFEPYIHNNSGGLLAKNVLYEGNWIHDGQTKDAFNIHPGGALIWNSGGQTFPDNVVFRNNRIERMAVEGILVQGTTNGVTLTGNQFGPSMEPVSNTLNSTCVLISDPCALKITGSAQKELIAKSGGTYNGWRIGGNVFCHGTRADGATVSDAIFDANDLGVADARWAGATYVNNTNAGAGCSLAPIVWPPGGSPPPPPTTTEPTTTEPPPTTTEPPPDPALSAAVEVIYVRLKWTPADFPSKPAIYRNGLKVVASTANDGTALTKAPPGKLYTYWLVGGGVTSQKVAVQG